MSRNMQQGDRHLQSQQWTGFENPQWNDESPPPYEVAVQQLQLQRERPHQVSSPVVGISATAVPARGERGDTARPASRSPDFNECCALTNEKSAQAILFLLLALSLFSVVATIYILTEAIPKGFTLNLMVGLAFFLPTSILFPGSVAAVIGVFNGKTAGLSVLIYSLTFYFGIILMAAIVTIIALVLYVVAMAVVAIFGNSRVHSSFNDAVLSDVAAGLFLSLPIQLAYIYVLLQISDVLIDYRKTIRGRGSSTPQ